MNLSCIHCHQPFILNHFNLGKASVTCPNSLCGFVARIDTLIEAYYGPTLGSRCTAMVEALNRPTPPDMIQWLNWKLEKLCNEWEQKMHPTILDTKKVLNDKKLPWYQRVRQQALT